MERARIKAVRQCAAYSQTDNDRADQPVPIVVLGRRSTVSQNKIFKDCSSFDMSDRNDLCCKVTEISATNKPMVNYLPAAQHVPGLRCYMGVSHDINHPRTYQVVSNVRVGGNVYDLIFVLSKSMTCPISDNRKHLKYIVAQQLSVPRTKQNIDKLGFICCCSSHLKCDDNTLNHLTHYTDSEQARDILYFGSGSVRFKHNRSFFFCYFH